MSRLRWPSPFRLGPRGISLSAREPSPRKVAVFFLQLDPCISAPQKRRRDETAAGACKRVQHDVACFGERVDDGLEGFDGFLGRVAVVAGILPRQHVVKGLLRHRRMAFRQKVGGFVGVAHEALARGIRLAEDEMPDRRKPGTPPCESHRRRIAFGYRARWAILRRPSHSRDRSLRQFLNARKAIRWSPPHLCPVCRDCQRKGESKTLAFRPPGSQHFS